MPSFQDLVKRGMSAATVGLCTAAAGQNLNNTNGTSVFPDDGLQGTPAPTDGNPTPEQIGTGFGIFAGVLAGVILVGVAGYCGMKRCQRRNNSNEPAV